MISFPNCKINLGLHITGKRNDGYHNLETVFYPVQWKDVLEIVRSSGQKEQIFVSGMNDAAENNICMKAYHFLREKYHLPPVDIHLLKNIPVGAGLGGGSSDGAFTLKLLNQKFELGLSQETLAGYALQLGSDCPFFISNQPSFASGRGEILEPVSVDLSGYYIFVVYPGIHISTADAFRKVQIKDGRPSLKTVISQPVSNWKEVLKNDFEDSVFEKHPAVGELKQKMYESGAVYASMTGSGSAVYGIFAQKPQVEILPAGYRSELLAC